MADARNRELERRAWQGDVDAQRRLKRISLRLGRCVGKDCRQSHAGTLEGKGDLCIFRIFCWDCGRFEYRGDTDNPELLRRAEEVWSKSNVKLRDLVLELADD